jgi:hypothetical protein
MYTFHSRVVENENSSLINICNLASKHLVHVIIILPSFCIQIFGEILVKIHMTLQMNLGHAFGALGMFFIGSPKFFENHHFHVKSGINIHENYLSMKATHLC